VWARLGMLDWRRVGGGGASWWPVASARRGWGPAARVEGGGASGRRRWREEGEAAAAPIRPPADGMGASRAASTCGGRGFFPVTSSPNKHLLGGLVFLGGLVESNPI
jgi:hypothetical protein